MSTYATQSTTVAAVLDGVAALCQKALGWAAGRVIEWHYPGRPFTDLDAGRSVVWYHLVGRKPDTESGALRAGTKTDLVIAVNLVTRGFLDGAHRDKRIQRDHWANQFLLENAFYGQMLFPSYEDRVGDEPPKPLTDGTVVPLSVGAMVASDIPMATKTRPEQGYIETAIQFEVPVVLKLSLDAAPALDDPSYGDGTDLGYDYKAPPARGSGGDGF